MKPGPVHLDLQELGVFELASPCPAKWGTMAGDERVRFCGRCERHVYKLDQLTFDEIRALVRQHDGRLCMRFFRRRDGTVVTRDCPRGLRALQLAWASRPKGPLAVLVPTILTLVAIAAVGVMSLFGDNLRQLFEMSGTVVPLSPPHAKAPASKAPHSPRGAQRGGVE